MIRPIDRSAGDDRLKGRLYFAWPLKTSSRSIHLGVAARKCEYGDLTIDFRGVEVDARRLIGLYDCA